MTFWREERVAERRWGKKKWQKGGGVRRDVWNYGKNIWFS